MTGQAQGETTTRIERAIPWWIDLGIVAFWLWLLAESWLEGQEIPSLLAQLPVFPTPSWPIAAGLLTVAATTGISAFTQRRRIAEDVPVITGLVDRWLGAGTFHTVNARARTVLLSILCTLLLAVSCAITTQQTPGEQRGYLVVAGAIAVAMGLLVPWLVSRRFPPVLR